MTLYVNRLRYKYGAPTLGASSGIVNQAFYNGLSFYDDDWQPGPTINYVKDIYTTATSGDYYIDTNINTTNIKKVRAIITPRNYTGNYLLGTQSPTDSSDFRFFNTSLSSNNSTCYLDWGSGRTNTTLTEIKQNVEVDITIYVDTSYVYLWMTYDGSTSNYLIRTSKTNNLGAGANFKASLSYMKLRMLQIWNFNDEMICDFRAALDENDQPCMYDEVSGNYFYKTGGTATMEYDLLPTPVTVNVSSNDQTMGTVSGGGNYYTGDIVIVSATATSDAYGFSGWYNNGTLVSSNENYSFVVSANITLQAIFYAKQQYTVTLSVNDSNMGSASGGGTYYENTSVTVTASPSTGYKLAGWYNNGTLVSTSSSYTFTLTGNVSLQATFEVKPAIDYSTKYFTIESLEDNNTITISSYVNKNILTNLSYKKEGDNSWTTIWNNPSNGNKSWSININIGDIVYFKGTAKQYASSNSDYDATKISSTKTFKVYGNIMSLLYGDNFANQTDLPSGSQYTFEYMFVNNTNIVDAENLIIPKVNADRACMRMFYGCTGLIYGPQILSDDTAIWCMGYMFYGCTSLIKLKCLTTDLSGQYCVSEWVTNVAANGTFIKSPLMTSWPTGNSGIPSGWTVQDA